jgi:hypothetical protein
MQDWYYSFTGSFGLSTKAELFEIAGKLDSFKQAHFWLTTRGLDLRPWQGSKRVCTRASNRTCNPEPDPSSHRKFVRVPVSPTRGSSRQIRSLGAFWNTYRTAVSRPRRFFRKTSPVEKRSTGKAISRILKTGLRRTPWRDCFFQHCQPVLMLCREPCVSDQVA